MANLFAGGPPSDECGWTGGDNEVWKLAKDGAHYRAMEKVLKHHCCALMFYRDLFPFSGVYFDF